MSLYVKPPSYYIVWVLDGTCVADFAVYVLYFMHYVSKAL